MDTEKKTNYFSGQVGFVLAAAGSAVGVGNLWTSLTWQPKPPGLFLLVYLALVLTFGFTLLTSDIARPPHKKERHRRLYGDAPPVAFSGHPDLFGAGAHSMTYYVVIGGWIMKLRQCPVPDGSGRCRRQDNLFYQLYLLAGYRLWCLPGHRLHRLQRALGWVERVSRYMMRCGLLVVVIRPVTP